METFSITFFLFLAKTLNTERLEHISDQELLREFKRSKNQIYIAELYRRYMHLIYGVCLKYLKNKADSQDLTADIYDKFLQLDHGSDIINFKAWLLRTTTNACLSHLRKEQTKAKQEENWLNNEKNQPSFMENSGLMRLINESSVDPEVRLLNAISDLDYNQQKCIRLFFFEKNTYKEIADKEGLTLKEVKSFLQNGKRMLFRKLKNR